MTIAPSTAQRLAAATRPHLPGPPDPGPSVTRLSDGCQAYLVDVHAPNPYSAELSVPQARDISATLKELADLTASSITIGQLAGATIDAGVEAQNRADALETTRQSLKSAYNNSTVKSIVWMGATAGALVLGGLLPNPITGLVIAGAAAMAIRSITKARADHKELVRQLPAIEQGLAVNRQLAADSVFFAPHLQGWNELLSTQVKNQAA
ncbi:MAG: hypothetical protein KC910_17835 [Candidatus Eremiobacteraeota bacterium]|nr:hypothetical protein [Candidatus Eremiobacteraeota bacterium]